MDGQQELLKAFEEGSNQHTASFSHQDSFAPAESVNLYQHLANRSSVANKKAANADPLDLDLERLMSGGEDRPWSEQDWQWDPFSMQAQPRKAGEGVQSQQQKQLMQLQAQQLQAQQLQAQQLQAQQLQAQQLQAQHLSAAQQQLLQAQQVQQQQQQQQQMLQMQQLMQQQQQQQQQQLGEPQNKRRKVPPNWQGADAAELTAALQSNLAAASTAKQGSQMGAVPGMIGQMPGAMGLEGGIGGIQLPGQGMQLQQMGSSAVNLEQYGSNRVWPSQQDGQGSQQLQQQQKQQLPSLGDMDILNSNTSGNQLSAALGKGPGAGPAAAAAAGSGWPGILDLGIGDLPLGGANQPMAGMPLGALGGVELNSINPSVFHNPAFVPQPAMPAMPGKGPGRSARAASDAVPASLQVSASSGGQHDTALSLGTGTGDDKDKMVCQVPGCSKDLSGLKDYHQRYRICDVHIKLPQVMKDNRLQRFCQQCGRFHDLSAFDGNRKSCREQLNKHNARRRRRAQMEQQAAVPEDLSAIADEKSEVGRLLQALLQNPTQLHAFRVLLGLPTHPALPPLAPLPAEHAAADAASRPKPVKAAAADTPAPAEDDLGGEEGDVPADPLSYSTAREITNGQGQFAPGYDSEHHSVRISLKLFDKTPSDLPGDLKQQLTGWLSSAPLALEGYIRPGCVFLTTQMLLPEADAQLALTQGMGHLLRMVLSDDAHPCWADGTILLQVGNEVAMVKDRTLLQRLIYTNRTAHDDSLPLLHRVEPLAVYGGHPFCFALHGHNLQQMEEQVVCRSQGQHFYPAVEYLPPLPAQELCSRHPHHHHHHPHYHHHHHHPQLASRDSIKSSGTPRLGGSEMARSSRLAQQESLKASGRGGRAGASSYSHGSMEPQHSAPVEVVRCSLPPLPGCRLLQVEVCKRGFLSCCRPLLVVDDPQLAAEVNSLAEQQLLGLQAREALLCDLGAVLAHAQGSHALPTQLVVAKARRLLVLACDLGWPAVGARVLPVALSGANSALEAVAAVEACIEGQEELTLLHRAVRSGSLPLVKGIMEWGEAHGYQWPVDKGGPYGLTPLHIAAMLDDDGVIALHLMDSCGPQAFTSAASDDGVTPFHLAFQMGHFVVDRLLQFMKDPDNLHVLEQHTRTQRQLVKQEPGQAEEEDREPPAGRCITRESNCLDACLACQSTVPPLLLSIMAHCGRCGAQRPWLRAVEDEREVRQREAAEACTRPKQQQLAESSRARRAAARAKAIVPPSEPALPSCPGEECSHSSCSHSTKAVYEITAMCQICHSNRVMTVN